MLQHDTLVVLEAGGVPRPEVKRMTEKVQDQIDKYWAFSKQTDSKTAASRARGIARLIQDRLGAALENLAQEEQEKDKVRAEVLAISNMGCDHLLRSNLGTARSDMISGLSCGRTENDAWDIYEAEVEAWKEELAGKQREYWRDEADKLLEGMGK